MLQGRMRWNLLLLSLLAVPAVAQTAPPAASAAPGVVVRAEAQTKHAQCGAGPALIEGNRNTIVLTGACSSLLLRGSANVVTVALQAGAPVRLEGSGNKVAFQAPAGGAPAVQLLGAGNSVDTSPVLPEPVAAPAPPPPAAAPAAAGASAQPVPDAGAEPLRLSGSDEHRIQDCSGRAVVIEGDRNAYVLRGGCQSVSVQGDVNMVQAELQPAAPVSITGQGTTVSWAGSGKPPVATLRGDDNRVQRTVTIGGQPIR